MEPSKTMAAFDAKKEERKIRDDKHNERHSRVEIDANSSVFHVKFGIFQWKLLNKFYLILQYKKLSKKPFKSFKIADS